MDIVWFLCV